jgi:hypothetical protein
VTPTTEHASMRKPCPSDLTDEQARPSTSTVRVASGICSPTTCPPRVPFMTNSPDGKPLAPGQLLISQLGDPRHEGRAEVASFRCFAEGRLVSSRTYCLTNFLLDT